MAEDLESSSMSTVRSTPCLVGRDCLLLHTQCKKVDPHNVKSRNFYLFPVQQYPVHCKVEEKTIPVLWNIYLM